MARRNTEPTGPRLKDEKKLTLIHDRFNYSKDRWDSIRKEAKIDMRHVLGDPWDPAERAARLKAKRPVIALDELSQYENQVVNEVRSNPRGIKFDPVGDGANDKTALFYGNKTREIEYRSHAQQHYTRAFQNMVERSYGYCKVQTEYITNQAAGPQDPWSAFNKRLKIDGVADPDSIYPDPDFVDATGRDWSFLFEIESRSQTEFKKKFPKAEIQDFTPELVKFSNGWINQQQVRIASYWELEKPEKLLQAWEAVHPEQGPQIFELWKDTDAERIELVQKLGGTLKAERMVPEPTVTQYVTNGVEILSKTPWPGKWIPYAAFFGKMMWVDLGKGPELVIMSMTRLARDPNMLHAYYASCEAENIGRTPKTPWWVWKGSVDKANAIKIQKANHEPVAFIEIDTVMSHNQQQTPSLPTQILFDPQTQSISIGKEGARQSIRAAMAIGYLPTPAQRNNEKSGIALDKIKDSFQQGSYHFIDSYDMGIMRCGELIEDLMDKVYDTKGETALLMPDGKSASVFINGQPAQQPAKGVEVLESIKGQHAVTISVGPAKESERAAASDFVDTFVGSPIFQALPPEMGLQILSLLVKLKNLGPIGDQIAELLSPQEEEGAIPPNVKAALEQGKQIVAALQQKIQELEQEKAAKVMDNEGKLAIEALKSKAQTAVAEGNADADMAEAELRAQTEIRLQEMQDEIDLLKLAAEVKIEGAKLEQQTVTGERSRVSGERQAGEERKLKASTAELNAKTKQQQKPKGRK